ncbi:hypothetical protein E3E22_00115 [Thermococcus sp. MV5]|uniref:hypothetical protein n=1 Tax=Thermococcus sp. MV5 TaxID=1638272 RepID=UPI00143C2D8A|nr:hypothetical protein [Thermococcus sp. MV5]NJE25057.1 hypothetical protein [Thermococcus sp. MV5]
MQKKFKLDAGKILILLFLAYLIFLFWSMRAVQPPPHPPPEEEQEIMLIAKKLGFLNDNKLSEEEKTVVLKVYRLYKYRTTLFDEVETDNPSLLANLSGQISETLERVPLPLQDDMVRFLFSESPYTLEDFSNRVMIFKSQVNEFLKTYEKLPPRIKNGIENSRNIYEVNTLQDYIAIVKLLYMNLYELPPDIITAIDSTQGILDGFEPHEIEEFLDSLNSVKERFFVNQTFREWFVENSGYFDATNIKASWDKFVQESQKDTTPPKIWGVVTSEGKNIRVSFTVKDNVNVPKEVIIKIGAKVITLPISTNSLTYSSAIEFEQEWGEYNITITGMDTKGNKHSAKIEFSHYPEIFEIKFDEGGEEFQNARAYTKEELTKMWRYAAKYKPLQIYKIVYPYLGFDRYGKIKFDGAMEFFYEKAKRDLFKFYHKPLPFYSITPLHIAYFVNSYVHSYDMPYIKTLRSSICGYDGETQVVLMNNLFLDFNLKAWALQVPASISGWRLDHSEIIVIWDVPLLVGSNYKGVYVLGKDPYIQNDNLFYPYDPDWFSTYYDDTVEMMTLGILPYRPDMVSVEEFYKRFNFRVTPAYPYKNLMKELITGYEFFASYVTFNISKDYVQGLLEKIQEGDLSVLEDLNKLEAARGLWYRLDGRNLYYGSKYTPDYVTVTKDGRFYYVHRNRSKIFSTS